MSFTDEIVYKNSFSVYGFIDQLSARNERTPNVALSLSLAAAILSVVVAAATESTTVFRTTVLNTTEFPAFESYLEGKMPADAIVLGGPRTRNFAKSPQKGPHYGLAALGFPWITLDERDTSFAPDFGAFSAIFLSFWTSLDVLER